MRTRRIVFFILISALIYFSIIAIFAWLYFKTGSICYTQTDQPVTSYFDCFYFSLTSFQTIGFGDITPHLPFAKQLIFAQSILSILFTAFFSGLLIYFYFKRPNDIFTSNNYFIRFANNKYLLSIRVGNKGANIIDCKITVQILKINNKQIRTRLITLNMDVPLVEKTWYADFEFSQNCNKELLVIIKEIIIENNKYQLRFILTGFDSKSGSPVMLVREYLPDKLSYGSNYSHVHNWDAKTFRRTKTNWKNFNQIESPLFDLKDAISKL